MSAENQNQLARDYTAAFAQHGSRAYIANLDTTVGLHRWGEHLLPITINDGAKADTFVCSPRVGYIDYPREELARFPARAVIPALRAIIEGMGGLLSLSDLDRIVHIHNWMMSTNHPVKLDHTQAARQTSELADRYPAHVLAIRSLTRRYSRDLIEALCASGWMLLPSRQVFLVDDVAHECLPRRDTKRDERLWARQAYRFEEPEAISDVDAARIVDLYGMLYLDKYSRLNPHYTASFITMTQKIGLLRYLLLRDDQGVIQAFGGMYRSGIHATMPLIGYDTSLSQDHGLYRLACHAGVRFAAQHNLLLNMSSGATAFKRSRGATAEMEYTAFYVSHLPWPRRKPMEILRIITKYIGEPLLLKYNL
jgi:hypothetical protein